MNEQKELLELEEGSNIPEGYVQVSKKEYDRVQNEMFLSSFREPMKEKEKINEEEKFKDPKFLKRFNKLLNAKCGCWSGKKLKYCCYKQERPEYIRLTKKEFKHESFKRLEGEEL